MTGTDMAQVLRAWQSGSASVRLRAALALGTSPDPRLLEPLVARCAIEPDFSVREMLTWALTRFPATVTVPALVAELGSASPRARSQALHTLSKIGDRDAWPAITRELLTDPDPEVARSAWRAAAALVPDEEVPDLVRVLATQFGRGDLAMRMSLSRVLIGFGDAHVPALRTAAAHPDPRVRTHAIATERLALDPDSGFDLAIEEAKRMVALGTTPAGG